MEINLDEIIRRFSRHHPRKWNWPISCLNDTLKPRKGDFREWRIPPPPPPAPHHFPKNQEACTSGSRLGNRSVFILDPRLMFMFCFLLLFQPGHLAIPEAYTRPPDLLPHRTDLTIQDTVSSLYSLAAYWFFTCITFLRPMRIHCLSWDSLLQALQALR